MSNRQTDRQTHRPRYICRNRPHLCIVRVMWPKDCGWPNARKRRDSSDQVSTDADEFHAESICKVYIPSLRPCSRWRARHCWDLSDEEPRSLYSTDTHTHTRQVAAAMRPFAISTAAACFNITPRGAECPENRFFFFWGGEYLNGCTVDRDSK